MMIFLLGSGPDPGLGFLSCRFTLALRVLNSIHVLASMYASPLLKYIQFCSVLQQVRYMQINSSTLQQSEVLAYSVLAI